MEYIITVVFALIAIKSILVGSEFSFAYWAKYGKTYTNWYFSKETFNEYLTEKEQQ